MIVVPSDACWPPSALGSADGPCRDAGGGWFAPGKPSFGAATSSAAPAPPPEAATAGVSAAVLSAFGAETAVTADDNSWSPPDADPTEDARSMLVVRGAEFCAAPAEAAGGIAGIAAAAPPPPEAATAPNAKGAADSADDCVPLPDVGCAKTLAPAACKTTTAAITSFTLSMSLPTP